MTQLEQRNPSMTFTFIDEHERNINGSDFNMFWTRGPNDGWDFNNTPGVRHGERRTPIAFADGHLEVHRWKDPRTAQAARTEAEYYAIPFMHFNNGDYAWLWERSNPNYSLPDQQ